MKPIRLNVAEDESSQFGLKTIRGLLEVKTAKGEEKVIWKTHEAEWRVLRDQTYITWNIWQVIVRNLFLEALKEQELTEGEVPECRVETEGQQSETWRVEFAEREEPFVCNSCSRALPITMILKIIDPITGQGEGNICRDCMQRGRGYHAQGL